MSRSCSLCLTPREYLKSLQTAFIIMEGHPKYHDAVHSEKCYKLVLGFPTHQILLSRIELEVSSFPCVVLKATLSPLLLPTGLHVIHVAWGVGADCEDSISSFRRMSTYQSCGFWLRVDYKYVCHSFFLDICPSCLFSRRGMLVYACNPSFWQAGSVRWKV